MLDYVLLESGMRLRKSAARVIEAQVVSANDANTAHSPHAENEKILLYSIEYN